MPSRLLPAVLTSQVPDSLPGGNGEQTSGKLMHIEHFFFAMKVFPFERGGVLVPLFFFWGGGGVSF